MNILILFSILVLINIYLVYLNLNSIENFETDLSRNCMVVGYLVKNKLTPKLAKKYVIEKVHQYILEHIKYYIHQKMEVQIVLIKIMKGKIYIVIYQNQMIV